MAVVIDEVTAQMEPPKSNSAGASQPPSQTPRLEAAQLATLLRRLDRRDARVMAD